MTDIVIDPRRHQALENLVRLYLSHDNMLSHGKEMKAAISTYNEVEVRFSAAPTKEEISALIEHLKLMQKVCPDKRERPTRALVNDALEQAGLPRIEEDKP